MKSINIVGMAILGWLAVAYTDKSYSVMSDEKISSPAVSTLKSDCVCVCCDDCECSEKDGCQECSTEKIKKEGNTTDSKNKP